MSLLLVSILIFLATLGLLLSGLYFLVEAPRSRRFMKVRLAGLAQTGTGGVQGVQASFVRSQSLSDFPALDRILVRLPVVKKVQLLLLQADVQITVSMLFSIMLGLGVFAYVILMVLRLPSMLAPAVSMAIAAAPLLWVFHCRSRRLYRFQELFPDAMDMLARAVRAGHAFTTGLQLIADELAEPVSKEFRITFEQQNLGMPLREALADLSTRVPLADVRIFVSTLQIQRESGGNLAEILDSLSAVVRERFKLLREARTRTAEGRLSLYILTGLPIAAGLLMTFINPDYMNPLFTNPLGHKMILGAAGMQVIGYLAIRRIVTLKV